MEQRESVVTSVAVDPRDPERVRITVGDRVYVVDPYVPVALGLRAGKPVNAAVMRELAEAAAESDAKSKALRLLARRAYTEYEIRRHLLEAKVPEVVVERVIAWLLELGYVDDRAFAHAWVEDRAERKGVGPLLLSYELSQRGVAPEIIRETLAALMNDERMETIAITQAERRLARYKNNGTRETYGKIYAFLQRRGFPSEVIQRVLSRLID